MPARRQRKVTSPRLKAYLEAKKHDTLLLGAVDRYIQMLPDDRDATVIHPSEMSKPKWCPRATWHRLVGHKRKERTPLPIGISLIYEVGSESGWKWQRWTRDMGILWGRWVCATCSAERLSWSDELSLDPCPDRVSSAPHLWEYKEVPLTQGLIGGHADGIVNPSGDESLVMENKTIGPGTLRMLSVLDEKEDDELSPNKFGRITAVLPSHFMQTQIYLRLAQDLAETLGPINRAVIIYEHKMDQKVREFVVRYDPRWTDDLWDIALDIEWQIGRGREVKCPYGGCAECWAYEEGD